MNRHESAKMPWKILNHTDKLFGEVTTRAMTEEERQKYGEASQIQKLNLGVDEYMSKLNITTEELLKDCKKFGTSWEACKFIGNRHNLTQKQVYNLVLGRKIKEKLETEKDVESKETEKVEEPIGITEVCKEHKDCVVTQHKRYKEHSLGLPEGVTPIAYEVKTDSKGIAINFADLDEVEVKQRPHEDYLDALAAANEIRDKAAKPRLRPNTLISQSLNGKT